MGATLSPPPQSAQSQARISSSQAIAAVTALGIRPDVLASEIPTATLADFTDSILGQSDPTLGAPPLYSNVLVWDVQFANAPSVHMGGHPVLEPLLSATATADPDEPGATTPAADGICPLHAIVDATSGKVLLEFQDCS